MISGFVYSQSITLKIISSRDELPIEGTLIYNENVFLGETNSKGEFTLARSFDKLKIIKEGYDDLELVKDDVENWNGIIKLNPIALIELEELILTNISENPLSVLRKVKESRYKQFPKPSNYFHSKVEFKCEDQTIFSFNNVIFLSESLQVNNKNRIIYAGKKKTDYKNNLIEVFEIYEKECQIPVTTSIYCSLGFHEISPVFEGNLYNYELEKTADFFVLRFTPKKKNAKLLYKGYFIIDKSDYGIIELHISLANSKNNFWTINSYKTDQKTKYTFQIMEDTFMFKFSKSDNNYFLESSSRNMTCIQKEGNHIGKQFSFNFYNEETVSHSGLEFKEYDFINNTFKK
ncbi:hypothetical protein CHU92_04320 [Flavobacterium cyanobacteriorum]|uniref:Uncharacterized protein n=1 Tax=Flavobacterium cyanobacteriorum TaxID=2022802 RepID=A0A255ZJ50_9FLAO|nr:hypothetical protein CHU92_04320 [Flavobacterium cyanobacteriorum]